VRNHFFFSHHEDLEHMVQTGLRSFKNTGILVITGESGVGKSDLAAKVHKQTTRNGSYLSQDASGFATARFESQLYGHARGAFSSAVNAHAGFLDVVGKGTLCIENLEDLDISNQARMLRFLESGYYRPVGANLEKHFPGRLIFTSRIAARKLMESGAIRSDFYYRIAHFEIKLPPIYERPLDFEPIFAMMVSRIRKEVDVHLRIPAEIEMELLKDKSIEGNYHGLKNMLQQSMIQGEPLPNVIPFELREEYDRRLPNTGSLRKDLFILEGRLLTRAINDYPRSRKGLAKALGISLRSLMYKLKEHNLS